MNKLKLLALPLICLSVSIGISGQFLEAKAQATGDGEELIEDTQDDLDLDNLDQMPVYDGQPGEEVIEDPEDVIDSDNFDQTSVDPTYNNVGEEEIENLGDIKDIDTIDRMPVYDGQPGEEAVEDPTNELDIDNMDRVEVEN